MLDGKITKHESFGMIGISRITTNANEPLFGSSIKHSNFIRLRIGECEVSRDLHRDWYFSPRKFIEVDLSASQFTEFITTPNVEDGVPCTIRYREGKSMEPPPFEAKGDTFHDEFKADVKKVTDDLNQLIDAMVGTVESKKVNMANFREVLGQLRGVKQHIEQNMPFVYSQFTKQMDKTVTEAKGEIDSFVTTMIHKTGLEYLKKIQPSIEHDKDEAQQNGRTFLL